MRAYRLACELLDQAWPDAEQLQHHFVTREVAPELYAAVGSVLANINEGYSRSSGRDRARIFEYALSSTRECLGWYQAAKPVLGSQVTEQRVEVLIEIRRLLLAIIPRERNRLIRPTKRPESDSDPVRNPKSVRNP
jgi:four helix bundle protein